MAPAQFAVASLTFERVPMRTKRPIHAQGFSRRWLFKFMQFASNLRAV